MHLPFKSLVFPLAATLALFNVLLPSGGKAQTYPIDCAILLCLSGGWPTSVPCTRARAEFLRRITPWPIEPPLQIWRCPIGASYEIEQPPRDATRSFDALFQEHTDPSRQSFAEIDHTPSASLTDALWRRRETVVGLVPSDFALRLVQNHADIDISGPEFNFVRSIRVFDVRYAWQHKAERGGDCSRDAAVFLGTYGSQGEFSWQQASASALPPVHTGLEQWGEHCPNIFHRSVFVDWHDFDGNYGSEQVNY